MTVTPAALAIPSMCAPVPESSGQMISTVAPLAMADCAMLTCTASLPSAFCTLRSDDGSPAAANAAFRYGASKNCHRVDDVVSGRMTATFPLPLGASTASAFRALNEGLISLTVRDGSTALEFADAAAPVALAGADAELALELQAAASSAALRPTAVRPALFIRPALFVREDTTYLAFHFSRPVATARAGSAGRASLHTLAIRRPVGVRWNRKIGEAETPV